MSNAALNVLGFKPQVINKSSTEMSDILSALDRSNAVIEFKMDGTIITANANFLGAVGYTLDEVKGKHHSLFVDPKEKDSAAYAAFWEKLNQGVYQAAEFRRFGKGGKEIWIEASYKETDTARIAAENAKEARGEFLANMSHELRTPMNGIIGLSGILAEMNLGGERQNLAEAVNSSARNLLILLNDILDFSKIEAGELTIESIPFDLHKVVRQIESLQSPMASQKGLVMQCHIDDHVPRGVVGDPTRLQQVLNNLVSNAIKFTEHGSVTIRLGGHENAQGQFEVRIAVEDTGIGVPKDKQAQVFEKFQQADASTSRKYGGTGLGLAITKNIVRLMDGVIAIDSEEGKGTTMTVTFTAAIAQIEDEQDKTDILKTITLNTDAAVLIVDDHPINLLFMRNMMTRMGFNRCEEVSSGRQAIDLCHSKHYDIIIMDCQMPDMDGFETAAHIRELQNGKDRSVIIAATADAMKGAAEKCLTAGMDAYISKPIEKDKLCAILHRYIPGNGEQGARDIFNHDHLYEFTQGDPEMEKSIIAMFVDNLKNDIAALDKSFQAKDYQEWDSWVHKIYGACSHVGAAAMADICDRAQSLTDGQEGEIPVIHAKIMAEYQRIMDFVPDDMGVEPQTRAATGAG